MLWQLDAVRRHLRELPPDSPESAHLHGITDAIPVGAQSLASLRLSLMAYAYFLEHEGRLEEALEVLALAVRTHGPGVPAPDFAASALFAGRLNRSWRAGLLPRPATPRPSRPPSTARDKVLMLRASLGRGAVLRGQATCRWRGRSPRRSRLCADHAGLREVEAMAYADLGAVLFVEGGRWTPSRRSTARSC